MITALYVSFAAVLIVWLSFRVIQVRRAKQISIGDGHDPDLMTAMAAQSNALEYLPIALLLLGMLEYNGAVLIVVHLFGILLLLGRIIHARALFTDNLNARVVGMQMTFGVIIGLVVANLLWLPYHKLI